MDFKNCNHGGKIEKREIPVISGQIFYLCELNRPPNTQPGGFKPTKKSNQLVKSTFKPIINMKTWSLDWNDL